MPNANNIYNNYDIQEQNASIYDYRSSLVRTPLGTNISSQNPSNQKILTSHSHIDGQEASAGPVNIEQFIRQSTFMTKSTADFREANTAKPVARSGDRTAGRRQKVQGGAPSKRLDQNFMTKKQVISPNKISIQVSASSQEHPHGQSASAQGSLK